MKARFWILAALAALPSAPAATQQSIAQPGTIVHRQANAHFPEAVGDFHRVEATQYDKDGNDISATYHLDRRDGQLRLTVYVYPAPAVDSVSATRAAETQRRRHCDREFGSVRSTITSGYQEVRRIENGEAPSVAGVSPGLSRRIVYEIAGKYGDVPQGLRSEVDLYCFVGGRWLVKYRATSNADFDAAPAIEQFIRNGPWPDRAPVDPGNVTMRSPGSAPAG